MLHYTGKTMTTFKINTNIDGWPVQKNGKTLDKKEIMAELNSASEVLEKIKEWDINNKMKQGQFLIPERLRREIQEITKI